MSEPSVSEQEQLVDDLHIQRCEQSRINEVNLDDPGFGDHFSDHMLSIKYEHGDWQVPEIIPFGDFSISPANATLHYGQTVFEGMKAFHGEDGSIRIFRMQDHLERLNRSCKRMCIPKLDTGILQEALKTLIKMDRNWVPTQHGNSLYIRPLAFAADANLGVAPAKTYQLLIMTSPVGAYYDEGFDPVSLTTTKEYIRSAKGGSGFAKTACNYGPTLLPAKKAHEDGYTQVIWLDAKERRYIEEVGTMNLFFKIDGQLYTPSLNGTILGGITRDSVIKLAQRAEVPVYEQPLAIDQVFDAAREGTLEEAFGSGTAAVISPIGSITHDGDKIMTNKDQIGPFAQQMFDTITAIQYGKQDDPYNWTTTV